MTIQNMTDVGNPGFQLARLGSLIFEADVILAFETFDCRVNVADLYEGLDFIETP